MEMPHTIFVHVLVLVLVILPSSFSQRRIKDGRKVTSDKRYAVYLLKTPDAPVQNNDWTCGGAIISQSLVVTAAACVNDLQRMYVIAGYRKFVTSSKIEEDECTSRMKKRIVFTCSPKGYNLDYDKTENWASMDLAVVKTDSPFDFNDKSYEKYCSYRPGSIMINYESACQKPGTDAFALGWGHSKQYETKLRNTSYNLDTLHYAPTQILDNERCLKYFSVNPNMWPTITKYMICTLQPGNLDDNGNLIVRSPASGCIIGRTCPEERNGIKKTRSGTRSGAINQDDKETHKDETEDGKKEKHDDADTPGICQNDHGGPLITWEGSHEILIGVATIYKLNNQSMCIGPYLFTSTACNSQFLHCILKMDKNEQETGRRYCENQDELPFKMVERRISWGHHHSKPTNNGNIYKRPQVPISAFDTS